MDKSNLADGPWKNEPDDAVWENENMVCAVTRGPWMSLCGYVGIPDDHILFGVHYDDKVNELSPLINKILWEPIVDTEKGLGVLISMLGGKITPTPDTLLRVHGGLTYAAAKCPGPDHPLRLTKKWWFGFNAGHAGDFAPGLYKNSLRMLGEHSVYRDFAYMSDQTDGLANQLFHIYLEYPRSAV